MYWIYGKWAVAQAVARLCEYQNISYELFDDSDEIFDFSWYDAIIVSPWVPAFHRVYQSGKVIAELDFAFQFLKNNAEIIAVTGTDGKSTTTWMLYQILKNYYTQNREVYISGNFEIPFSETVLQILKNNIQNPLIIIEISSFMAYFIGKSILNPFAPDITIFTNFQTDHIVWHETLQNYFDAKMNICNNTKKYNIVNSKILDTIQGQSLNFVKLDNMVFFGDKKTGNYTDGNDIYIDNHLFISLSETNFSGIHNAYNILSVMMVVHVLGYSFDDIKVLWKDIFSLPHRLENLWKYGRVQVIEDSKSTSSQSLEAALWSYWNEKNILLIAGWFDKGDNFEYLLPLFKKRVRALAAIGDTKKQFSDLAKQANIQYIETDNLQSAVDFLYALSNENDILMLSPGCSSFGLFRDYLDRANQFREIIQKLS